MATISAQPIGEREARPARIGGYALSERLGQTGMANLYRAVHTGPNGFEKTVVIKAMLPALADNPELVARFTAEAKTTAQLSHAGIAQVYDFGVDQGIPFVVMEDLDGINLLQLMCAVSASGKRVPLGVAIVIGTEICQALGFAHSWRDRRGVTWQIIHSDVAPANVMVCRDGSVKLLDFGVARFVEQLDYEVLVKARGNFAYMAPEQLNQLPFDRRVDVFAVGVLLYELLTGRRLFGAQNDLDTLRRVDATEVKPPSLHNPEVTPELDLIVLKAVSRDPDDRFSDGMAMATALQQLRHFGGGRRRVAEFMTSLFPETWQIYCEACHKQLAPVLMCTECSTDVPVPESAIEVDLADEKPAMRNVPPPPPPKSSTATAAATVSTRPVRTGGGAYRALLAVSIIALSLVVGVDVAERRRPVPQRAPVALQPEPQIVPPTPVPSSPALSEPPAASIASPLVDAPKPATERRKVATRVVQRALPHLSIPAPAPAPAPASEFPPAPPESSDPRLLNPFGAR